MITKEKLLAMADLAERLESEGVEIISASVDMVQGPRLQLWSETVPAVLRVRAEVLWRTQVADVAWGFEEAGVTIFWARG